MDTLRERVEADEQEEGVHRDLHDAQRGRAPEEHKRAMDERMGEQEQRKEEEGGLGERRAREREVYQDLGNSRESGPLNVRTLQGTRVQSCCTHRAVLERACQRIQGAIANQYHQRAIRESLWLEGTPSMAYRIENGLASRARAT